MLRYCCMTTLDNLPASLSASEESGNMNNEDRGDPNPRVLAQLGEISKEINAMASCRFVPVEITDHQPGGITTVKLMWRDSANGRMYEPGESWQLS